MVFFEYDSKEAFEANAQYLKKSFSKVPKTRKLMVMAKVEVGRGVTTLVMYSKGGALAHGICIFYMLGFHTDVCGV